MVSIRIRIVMLSFIIYGNLQDLTHIFQDIERLINSGKRDGGIRFLYPGKNILRRWMIPITLKDFKYSQTLRRNLITLAPEFFYQIFRCIHLITKKKLRINLSRIFYMYY